MSPRTLPTLAMLAMLACAGPSPQGQDTQGGADGNGSSGDGGDCSTLAAVLTADRSHGELPLTVEFSVEISCPEGEASVRWDLGDGQLSNGQTATHTWLASGTYQVSATITDDSGTPLTLSKEVVVSSAVCPELEEPQEIATIDETWLIEASGLAHSRLDPGVVWTHNDSGDTPRLLALDATGALRHIIELDGVESGDWEDLALLPDPLSGVPRFVVADTGDNDQSRETVQIYQLPEPPLGDTAATTVASEWTVAQLAFPDGQARNINTMMVDPVTGHVYLAAFEADGLTSIWRATAPLDTTQVTELASFATVSLVDPANGQALAPTGGAFSPLGDRFVLRTPDRAWLWRRDQSDTMSESWAGEPCDLALPDPSPGEAIAFSSDGGGIYTITEGAPQTLWFTPFVAPEAPCDGFEARIITDRVAGGIPFQPLLGIDPDCVPAGVASLSWDLGPEGSASELSPRPTYLASGEVEISVEVTDDLGAVDTDTIILTVQPAACPAPGEPVEWGEVESEDVIEASGLGQSTLNPGVLWTHNDSGNSPSLYAMAEDGTHLGEFLFSEGPTRDWEDLALGFDDHLDTDVIYVGDIGDNAKQRDDIWIFIVEEPVVDPGGPPVSEEFVAPTPMTLLYPDGPENSETLMWDPVTSDLIVVTKDYEGDTKVFVKHPPHVAGETTELILVSELDFGDPPLTGSGATTGGAVSPLGDLLSIRSYSHAYAWRRDQTYDLSTAFAGEPCDLEAPSETQGEALEMATDGSGYLLVSEGSNQPIWYVPLD